MENENLNEVTEIEQGEETVESFGFDEEDKDWDNVQWGNAEENTEDNAEGSDEAKATEEASQEVKPTEKEEAEPTEDYLELKHFDEIRKVSKDEAKTLAQKGLDYDRIKTDRDNMKGEYKKLKDYEAFLEDMRGDFSTIDEMISDIRAKTGKSASVSTESANQREEKPDRDSTIQRFVEEYPEVKAEDIPGSVWDEVKTTGDLVKAYSNYEKKTLKDKISSLEQELSTLKNNQSNAARSVGSAKTSGNAREKSMIAKLWEEDD